MSKRPASDGESEPISHQVSGRERGMVGRTYFERGNPVTVIRQWGPGGGPRNVLIRRNDGQLTVRPFRGLRKQPPV